MAVVEFGDEQSRNIGSFNAQEDSTPIDPSDTTGGTGQITISQAANADTEFLEGEEFTFTDKSHGVTTGVVEAIAIHGLGATLTANSMAAKLVATRIMPLFNGTLGNAIRAYCASVGITSNVVIDATLDPIPVSLPGWQSEVWYTLKQLAVAYSFEISLVGANLVFRPLRGRETIDYRDNDASFGISRDQMAQAVEGYYYSNQYKVGAIAYPIGGWTPDVQVYQVDANETQEFDLPINATLSALTQPTAVNFVGRYDTNASVYSIAGNDGLPFTAAQWNAQGGKLTVSINDDQESIHVTIVGPNNTQYAPFRIAQGSGPSDFYSSLRLIGTGVFYTPIKVTVNTGADPDRATQEVGATVQNRFLSTLTQLFDSLIWTVARYSGPRGTMTVSTRKISRRDERSSYSFPTIGQFNALYAGLAIADLNALFAGQRIADFNTQMQSLVKDNFENQLFGNIGGARRKARDNWWRIRTASDQGSKIDYTAEIDTTIDDFNDVWQGSTIADYNAEWYRKSIAKFNLKPLRRDADRELAYLFPTFDLYPSSDLYPH